MKANRINSKLFVSDRFFTIAIRGRQGTSITDDRQFMPEYCMPASRQKWAADPMLVDANGKTYLFYEAVLGDKGHIEVAEVQDDCSLTNISVVLQDSTHYSYPFVFKYRDEWFMIPETSEASEVRLYRSVSFPSKWEMSCILLEAKSVDTTVLCKDGQLYLLTFYLTEGTERVIPHAFKLYLSGEKASIDEIPWDNFNPLKARGAGGVFSVHHRLIRPAQINLANRYGDGIAFYEAFPGEKYQENYMCELLASDIGPSAYYVDGLHTYSCSTDFEAIDLRCGVIDYLKPLKKVLHR